LEGFGKLVLYCFKLKLVLKDFSEDPPEDNPEDMAGKPTNTVAICYNFLPKESSE